MNPRITFYDEPPRPTLIEQIGRLGLPSLDAEAANREVVRLTVENMRLQSLIDAREIKRCGI
jgi:hypothetical protein